MKEPRYATGKVVSAQVFNELVDVVKQLMRINIGPGMAMMKGAAGTHLASTHGDYRGGTLMELDSIQGTQDVDEWNRDEDRCRAKVLVLTDEQYDPATQKITYRCRPLYVDRGGHVYLIEGEGDLVEVTQAIACTAQL